jgi:hypothetical protein
MYKVNTHFTHNTHPWQLIISLQEWGLEYMGGANNTRLLGRGLFSKWCEALGYHDNTKRAFRLTHLPCNGRQHP